MKAIETEYNGVRFRSRLEARWAVFFDQLGVRWEYEPEAFELSDGSGYLPDFWLPREGTYVEIKPTIEAAQADRCRHTLFRRAIEEHNQRIGEYNHKYMTYIVLIGRPVYGECHTLSERVVGDARSVYGQVTACIACGRFIEWTAYSGGDPLSRGGYSRVGCMFCDCVERNTEDGPGYWFHKGDWMSDSIDLTWTPSCEAASRQAMVHRFWDPPRAVR